MKSAQRFFSNFGSIIQEAFIVVQLVYPSADYIYAICFITLTWFKFPLDISEFQRYNTNRCSEYLFVFGNGDDRMERVILHGDLNNYYASVECLYHPE